MTILAVRGDPMDRVELFLAMEKLNDSHGPFSKLHDNGVARPWARENKIPGTTYDGSDEAVNEYLVKNANILAVFPGGESLMGSPKITFVWRNGEWMG